MGTVSRFTQNLFCLQKAGKFPAFPPMLCYLLTVSYLSLSYLSLVSVLSPAAVFTGYYHNNAPGEHFSQPVLHSLLWALLRASMTPEVLSVLGVSLSHKIVVSTLFHHPPPHRDAAVPLAVQQRA